MTFHDRQLNSITFQAWKLKYFNSMTFQVFHDLDKPCFRTLDKCSSYLGVLVAQWVEHLNGATEVVGLITAYDSDFSVVLLPIAKPLVSYPPHQSITPFHPS